MPSSDSQACVAPQHGSPFTCILVSLHTAVVLCSLSQFVHRLSSPFTISIPRLLIVQQNQRYPAQHHVVSCKSLPMPPPPPPFPPTPLPQPDITAALAPAAAPFNIRKLLPRNTPLVVFHLQTNLDDLPCNTHARTRD
jgi:hypothetical protein